MTPDDPFRSQDVVTQMVTRGAGTSPVPSAATGSATPASPSAIAAYAARMAVAASPRRSPDPVVGCLRRPIAVKLPPAFRMHLRQARRRRWRNDARHTSWHPDPVIR